MVAVFYLANKGGGAATGTASHARQVRGEKPDEEAAHRSSSIAVGRSADNPTT